jgi:hypothetical protein
MQGAPLKSVSVAEWVLLLQWVWIRGPYGVDYWKKNQRSTISCYCTFSPNPDGLGRIWLPKLWTGLFPQRLKGTNALDFRRLFLNFFCIFKSPTYRYKTQFRQHFRKYTLNSPSYSKFLITHCFRQKCEARLSVVAESVELNLALSL